MQHKRRKRMRNIISFNVKMGGGHSVGITWQSLIWFFIVTAAATTVGELVYQKWVAPYLANLPSLPPKIVNMLPAPNTAVVSVQTPAISTLSGIKRAT